MNFLDSVLPIYVDYLGRYDWVPGEVESPADVMKALLDRGVTDRRNFLPNGEVSSSGQDGNLMLRDNVRQTVVRRFPFSRLRDPTAFISREQQQSSRARKSGFTRVVVVREDGAGHGQGRGGSSPVFHAFQCLDNNPDDLVQMIEDGISASMGGSNRANSLDNNWFSGGAPNGVDAGGPIHRRDQHRRLDPKTRRLYEGSDDMVERFTVLLNLCIEDIEYFCSDVREIKAAAESGGGAPRPGAPRMEDLQATDFTQIFQKFKLSFNLLSYLQGHIHNPDAEEMLHHLFPPLAFLVDVCFEEFGDELVKDVVAPLPTRRAIRMLNECLNSREMVIWKALGDFWKQPRENWEGTIPVYRPVFHGWSPGVVRFPEDDEFDQMMQRAGSGRSKKTSSVSSNDDVFRGSGRDAFRDELMAKNARIALVTYDWKRQNPRELSVTKGEYLQVLDDEKKWWKCRNEDGEVGFVPSTMAKAIIYTDRFDLDNGADYYEGRGRSRHARRGRSASPDSDKDRSSSPAPSIPPPAPPMPAVLPEVIKDRRHEPYYPDEIRPRGGRQTDTMRSNDSMQKELKTVLAVYREQAKEKLNIKKTPDLLITQDSTATEVRNWLEAKQFSKRVTDQTAGMHGNQLMGMSRKDLIEVFGKDEGKRLYSQITISRNSTNYKTVRSSELKEVLEKARKRSEKKGTVQRQRQESEEYEEEDYDADELSFSRV